MSSPLKGYSKQVPRLAGLRSLPKAVTKDFKVASTHLIDGVYQGFVNSSYQRDGFGYLITDDFHAYLGFFKYNKIHGRGLIIYPNGSIIYGHFVNGKLDGIALTDNNHEMQIGTFKQDGLLGIGFQYNYQRRQWKMNRYHKRVAIQILLAEQLNIEEGVPQIFGVQPLILQHFMRYRTKQFFQIDKTKSQDILNSMIQDLNTFYYHQMPNRMHFYGAIIDDKYEGLGIIYDPLQKAIVEAGMYRNGQLNGYGIKVEEKRRFQQIGLYNKGKKQGIFYQNLNQNVKFMSYSQGGTAIQPIKGYSFEKFQKDHKIYNYRVKDFLSLRHGIQFNDLQRVFQSGEYKAWKQQIESDNKRQKDPSKQSKHKIKTPVGHTNSLMSFQTFEKTSVILMKQKIANFTSKKKKQSSSNKLEMKNEFKIIENKTAQNGARSEDNDEDSDQIAVQENPIQLQPNLFRKKPFNFNH